MRTRRQFMAGAAVAAASTVAGCGSGSESGETTEADNETPTALFRAAEESRRYGNGAWGTALDKFEREDYASATGYYGRAYANYLTASELYSDAAESSGGELGEAASGNSDFSRKMAEAARHLETSTYYYAIGDRTPARSQYTEGWSLYSEAQEAGVVEADDLGVVA